jgi:uncharacterized protein (DUF4415 family)
MSKNKKERPLTDDEGEVRELTRADIRRFRPASEVLPPELYAMMVAHGKKRKGERGKQKTPTKEQITLRLDADVLGYFRQSGAGWQARINDVLKAIAATAPRGS